MYCTSTYTYYKNIVSWCSNIFSSSSKNPEELIYLYVSCNSWFFQYTININMNDVTIVFPIVVPPDPRGPWCEQFWIYIISESFYVNMTYSGSVVLEKKIFKWTHRIFEIISPLKRTWPFIWTIQNSLYPRMIYTKFYWNWPASSGEEDF
jgi:hypothetical protein